MSLPQWVLVISTLLAGAVLLGVLARRAGLPFTVVLTVFGFLAGWLGEPFGISSPLVGEEFEEVLVFLFLPALVFASALGLSVRSFFRNLVPILVLAVVTFPVSAALVGLALNFGLGIPLIAALVFGVLISATDPVAVVAIFRELGVPERLLTLVEGESMLNDGVAIVSFNILLAAALGGRVSVLGGFVEFFLVFFGGAAIGAAMGLLAALALPRLDWLAAAALSLAVAYGGFALAEGILGFSGITATVASGLVLAGLAPSRASQEVREGWARLWESFDYVANALLFLLVGLAIDPGLLADNIVPIALAIIVVLVSRAASILSLVSALERFAGLPPVGRRNEAVLIWGGLRGGVALALVLSLPESLPQRETFVAMTGGVVLATLLLNATTVGPLVRRLGLDRPGRSDRFLVCAAQLAGLQAARRRLEELGLENPEVCSRLDDVESSASQEVESIELDDEEQRRAIACRSLFVERQSYQRLSDAGLLPPQATRALLNDVNDRIEEVSVGRSPTEAVRPPEPTRVDRLAQRLTGWLPEPLGKDPTELAYAEASARRLAVRRASEALEDLRRLPNVEPSAIEGAKEVSARREREAVASLAGLEREAAPDLEREMHRRQSEALGCIASVDALRELSEAGLLPEAMVQHVAQEIAEEIGAPSDREL